MIKNLNLITNAERLWLWRQANQLTQESAANRLGICCTYYKRMERGRMDIPADVHRALRLRTRTLPTNPWPLARRRSGLGLHKAAYLAGFSHVGYLALERAADPRVAAFWQGLGFHV